MSLFRNIPIKRKLTIIVMLSTFVALLLSSAAFVNYDQIASRDNLVRELSGMAKIVGDNSAAALSFGDPASAESTLASLRASHEIIGAAIYDEEGGVFAAYQRNAKVDFAPSGIEVAGYRFGDHTVELFSDIRLAGEKIGTVYILSDLLAMRSRLWRYLQIVGVVMIIAFIVAYFLSERLLRTISGPISHLADVVGIVATEEDYSIRALKQDEDELGRLIDGFNEMLTQIQQRDTALHVARSELEERVDERTHELVHSLSLLNSTLNSTVDGILAVQLSGRLICCNDQFKAMWGIPSGMAERGVENVDLLAHVAPQVKDPVRFLARVKEVFARPEAEHLDVIELKDGRTFERHSKPQWSDGEAVGMVIGFHDISDRKRAAIELGHTHQRLLETSRMAGMAEVASSVLHNVGNVLNSVNVSATLVADGIAKSKVAGLAKAVALMREHERDLGEFLSEDARGKQLPAYLAQLSEHLQADQEASIRELDSLRQNISHIKEIVAMQQSYAGVSTVEEVVDAAAMVEDSLRMDLGAVQRHGIEIIREFENVPSIRCDKHKVLQILVNLVRNAQHSCNASARTDKRLTLRVGNRDGWLRIVVADNGAGISADNLTRIFGYGFTTKIDGHGFGLHGAALAAKEMRGSLQVHSEGIGFGAAFTLELPLTPMEAYA